MLAGDLGGYPDVHHDVCVLALRDAHGPLPAPSWTTYSLDVHPDCAYCGSPYRAEPRTVADRRMEVR